MGAGSGAGAGGAAYGQCGGRVVGDFQPAARAAGERALGRLFARTLQCARRDRGCSSFYEVPAARAARGSGPWRPNCAAIAPASTYGAMQGWLANSAARRISARTRPGAFVLVHSDTVEPATARFEGSWWRFGALAGHNALKIGHPASNCAVVLQVSGFLMCPVLFQSIVLVLAAHECICFKFRCAALTSEACQGSSEHLPAFRSGFMCAKTHLIMPFVTVSAGLSVLMAP